MWRFRQRRADVGPGGTPPEPWKLDELNLRRREVTAAETAAKSQGWVQLVQAFSVVVALASTVIAVIVARQSAAATNAAAEISIEQSYEGQLSSAISAMGTGGVSARVTNMLLIQRAVQGIMSLPLSTNEARQSARNDYTTTLSVLSFYIHNHTPSTNRTFGPGYGIPPSGQIPSDVAYAGGVIGRLLSIASRVTALSSGFSIQPALDLSNAELYGQSWPDVNFSQVNAYMPRTDLRGAYLVNSRWNNVYLAGSYLQCADLRGADLSGANLVGADLRGANVQNANFRGAFLNGANLGHLYGSAIGLPVSHSASHGIPNTDSCLHNETFWDLRA